MWVCIMGWWSGASCPLQWLLCSPSEHGHVSWCSSSLNFHSCPMLSTTSFLWCPCPLRESLAQLFSPDCTSHVNVPHYGKHGHALNMLLMYVTVEWDWGGGRWRPIWWSWENLSPYEMPHPLCNLLGTASDKRLRARLIMFLNWAPQTWTAIACLTVSNHHFKFENFLPRKSMSC